MPKILNHLQIDHRNMRQLLGILEEELEAYNTRGSADFDLMKQVLEYTLHYPSLIHHPRGETLFRRLLERDPASKVMVVDLTKEHEELAHLTHRFACSTMWRMTSNCCARYSASSPTSMSRYPATIWRAKSKSSSRGL